MTVSEIQQKRLINADALKVKVSELHPVVQDSLQLSRELSRQAASRGELPNFCDGNFVLVAPKDFHAGEKLLLRWRGPRKIVKEINEFVFQVKDLRIGS